MSNVQSAGAAVPAVHPVAPQPTSTSSHRPGIVLPESRDLSPAQWLAFRMQGIGSSEAAAAVGLDPWSSPLALWLEKTGRVVVDPDNDPLAQDDHPAFWGKVLEPFVARQYARRTGNRVRKVHTMSKHREHDWMRASLDYQVVGNASVQVLECKTVGLYAARYWEHGVPEYVQIQVQHQLAVTGKQAADVAVLIGGQELRIHRIERDEEVIAWLIELEAKFWQSVQQDLPPAADGSDSAQQALARLYPKDRGEVLDLTDSEVWNATFEQLLAVRAELEDCKGFEAKLRQSLCERLGEASGARFRQGSISWKRSKDSTTLDTARLLKAQPDLLNQYPLIREGSRRFVVKAQET